MFIRHSALLIVTTAMLSACSHVASFPYRIDIEQGNVISQQSLAQLHIGMRKSDVQQLLGTPLLQDTFHKNRWDYIHRYKNGRTQAESESKITLFFTNELLSRIEKDGYQFITTEPLPYSLKRGG